MAIIDNTLAAKVDTFDPATPLAQAAKIRSAEVENQQQQFKLIQAELGAEARGLQTFVNSPEFPQRWAEATDRLAQKGVLPAQMHAQLRNKPSPLMLKSIIAQTEDPALQFRKQEAVREQGNTDRDFGATQAYRQQTLNKEPDEIRKLRAAGVDPASPEGRAALFPKAGGTLGEIYDTGTGQLQKALINQDGTYKPVGGVKQQTVEPLDKEQAKKDVARVELYKTEADQGRSALNDVAQLRELRKGVDYAGQPLADKRATVTGWFGSGAGQALRSQATEIQLSFSEKTKGAITDREQAMFKGATPGLEMTESAAETVLNGMEAGAKRAIERGKFFESWMTENRSLSGAQEAWDRFLQEKPILSGDGKGGLKVNVANVDAWKPYVGKSERRSARTTGPTSPSREIPQAAIEALRANPNLKAEFEAHYGAGTAAAALR